MALWLGEAEELAGHGLIDSRWAAVLDLPGGALLPHALEARRLGLIRLSAAGNVVDVSARTLDLGLSGLRREDHRDTLVRNEQLEYPGAAISIRIPLNLRILAESRSEEIMTPPRKTRTGHALALTALAVLIHGCGSDTPTAPAPAAPSSAASEAEHPAGREGNGLTVYSVGAQVLQTCTPRPGGRWGPYSSDNLEIVAVSATVREIRIPENGRYNDGGPAEGRCSGIANPGGNTGSASNGWQNLFADVSPLRAGVPSALAVKWDADGTLSFNYDARSNDSAYTGQRKSVALPINGSSVEWSVVIWEDDPQFPLLPQVQNTLADAQTGLNTTGEYLRCGYAYRPHAENGAKVPMSARAEDGDFVVDLYEGCHVAEIYGDDGVLVGTGTPVFDAVPDGWTFVEDWETDSNGIEIAGTRHKAGMTHENGKSHVRWSVNATAKSGSTGSPSPRTTTGSTRRRCMGPIPTSRSRPSRTSGCRSRSGTPTCTSASGTTTSFVLRSKANRSNRRPYRRVRSSARR